MMENGAFELPRKSPWPRLLGWFKKAYLDAYIYVLLLSRELLAYHRLH